MVGAPKTIPDPSSRFCLRLGAGQLARLSAIARSPVLKRRLVEATTRLPAGARVRVAGERVVLGPELGSGLVGVVHAVEGAPVVYKRARGRFGFFTQALALEARAAEIVAGLDALRPARIHAVGPHALLKARVEGPTLQQLVVAGEVTARQRAHLVAALEAAHAVERAHGLLLDLSPKNLAWDGGWVLLDTGPKIHVSELSRVLERPSWAAYLGHFGPKIRRAASAPSALDAEGAPLAAATRWAFLADWWRWFPEDPAPPAGYFFAMIDETVDEDELVFTAERRPEGLAVDAPGRRSLTESPVIRAAARARWSSDTGERRGPLMDAGEAVLPPGRAPVSGPACAAQVSPQGFGKALGVLREAQVDLPQPTLEVRPYAHWRDLLDPTKGHAPTDIFSHAPMIAAEGGVDALARQLGAEAEQLDAAEGGFGDLLVVPGDARRAVLLVPGFRADARAALPLVAALKARGVRGPFVAACLGVRNPAGAPLVTAGRWEVPLLLDLIEHARERLDVDRVDIVAASHGIIGAVEAAKLHPAVRTLVLDSPMARPLDLVRTFCRALGVPFEPTLADLERHHLPSRPFTLEPPRRAGLRVLSLFRDEDPFLAACGPLPCGEVVRYAGAHAQTMRHDSAARPVPKACLDAMQRVLGNLSSGTGDGRGPGA